ncbi:MAG: hypothetical protein CO189_06020, partial [candidate division Zixibacteria bacterium CG_4_9_14_3_um_filter_46_8]
MELLSGSRKKLLWGLGASLVALFITIILGQTIFYDILQSFEAKTLDWRFIYRERLRDPAVPIEDIVIVDIDERSLEKYGQFPWPRSYHADLLERLRADSALGVAFDIQFFDAPIDSHSQNLFIESIRESGNIVSAVALYPEDKDHFRYSMDKNPYAALVPKIEDLGAVKPLQFDRIDGPPMEFAEASASLGFVNFVPDRDGITRHTPLVLRAAGDNFLSLSLALINSAFNSNRQNPISYRKGHLYPVPELEVPIDEDGLFRINFVGPPMSFRYISYYDVKERRLPDGYFQGKLVLVGTSARGLSDLKIVPISNEFPGVEIHATVMYNILTHQFLRTVSNWLILPLLIIITFLLGTLFYGSSAFKGFLLFLAIILGWFILVVVMFVKSSIIIELVRPIFTFSLTYVLVVVHRYFGEEQEKKKYRGILQHYVAPTVVKQIVDNIDNLKLGGDSRELTMLFSDIEGFTEVSERLTPQQLVTFMNAYTTIQTESVFEFFGTLDKYIGDAIVVIFGAPEVRYELNYPECACRAALKVSENDKIISERYKHLGVGKIRTRIGINTGEAVVGNMGSYVRFSYTALGDNVNLASRLEGLNKEYRTRILISEMTRNHTSKEYITRELDLVRVKGRSQPVRIYELMGYGATDDPAAHLIEKFSNALRNYRNRDFKKAEKDFLKILEFRPTD